MSSLERERCRADPSLETDLMKKLELGEEVPGRRLRGAVL